MQRHPAVLLIGPTGSGKTPLGDLLACEGLWARECLHFDFGANLRNVAALAELPAPFSPADQAVVHSVLSGGVLLENTHFHIALKLLDRFLCEKQACGDELIVLNGLPRHIGQAEDVDAAVEIMAVFHLACSPEVVHQRISGNLGADRTDRTDDSEAAVQARLRIFEERTIPLLDYYERRRIPVQSFSVTARTTPQSILDWMNSTERR